MSRPALFVIQLSLIVLMWPAAGTAERLQRGYVFAPPPEQMQRLLEGPVLIRRNTGNVTYAIEILRDDNNNLYIHHPKAGCMSQLTDPPSIANIDDKHKQFIPNAALMLNVEEGLSMLTPVQNDTCGMQANITAWTLSYNKIVIEPCKAATCSRRSVRLIPSPSWPGTMEAQAQLAVLVDGALASTDRKASASENVISSKDPNAITLAPYKRIYEGSVTDLNGAARPIHIYEARLGTSKKTTYHLYEPVSGCTQAIHKARGTLYDTPVWESFVNMLGQTITTQCDQSLRLSSLSQNQRKSIGRINLALLDEASYSIEIEEYKDTGQAPDAVLQLARGTIRSLADNKLIPDPAQVPDPTGITKLPVYPRVEGLVYKDNSYWGGFQDGAVLARVFNGDFEEAVKKPAFYQYLVAYVDEFDNVCGSYLTGDIIERTTVRWEEDQYGRRSSEYTFKVRMERRFKKAYIHGEGVADSVAMMKMIGAALGGLKTGGQRGANEIYNGLMNTAGQSQSHTKEMASFLKATGCQSATVRQLRENLYNAAYNLKSLQARGVEYADAAGESGGNGESAILSSDPVKAAIELRKREEADALRRQQYEEDTAALMRREEEQRIKAQQEREAARVKAEQDREAERLEKQQRMNSMQALGEKYVADQQDLLQKFQTDSQNATTDSEQQAIQARYYQGKAALKQQMEDEQRRLQGLAPVDRKAVVDQAAMSKAIQELSRDYRTQQTERSRVYSEQVRAATTSEEKAALKQAYVDQQKAAKQAFQEAIRQITQP